LIDYSYTVILYAVAEQVAQNIYFRFLSETLLVMMTTFFNWMPYSSQIAEELRMKLFKNALIKTKSGICTSKTQFLFPLLSTAEYKAALLNFYSILS